EGDAAMVMKLSSISQGLGWCLAVATACAMCPVTHAVTSPQQSPPPREAPAAQTPSQATAQGQTNDAAAQFARYAMFVGLVEIRLGELAMDLAVDQLVRDFAQKLIRDHTELNDRLLLLGRERGLGLPTADAFDRVLRARLDQELEGSDEVRVREPLDNPATARAAPVPSPAETN